MKYYKIWNYCPHCATVTRHRIWSTNCLGEIGLRRTLRAIVTFGASERGNFYNVKCSRCGLETPEIYY